MLGVLTCGLVCSASLAAAKTDGACAAAFALLGLYYLEPILHSGNVPTRSSNHWLQRFLLSFPMAVDVTALSTLPKASLTRGISCLQRAVSTQSDHGIAAPLLVQLLSLATDVVTVDEYCVPRLSQPVAAAGICKAAAAMNPLQPWSWAAIGWLALASLSASTATYAEAQLALDDDTAQEAVTAFQSAVRISKDSWWLWDGLARCYLKLRRFTAALKVQQSIRRSVLSISGIGNYSLAAARCVVVCCVSGCDARERVTFWRHVLFVPVRPGSSRIEAVSRFAAGNGLGSFEPSLLAEVFCATCGVCRIGRLLSSSSFGRWQVWRCAVCCSNVVLIAVKTALPGNCMDCFWHLRCFARVGNWSAL